LSQLVIKKRSGKEVPYAGDKIITAVKNAMMETDFGVDNVVAEKVEKYIRIVASEKCLTVEEVQDLVETLLGKYGKFDVARQYIKYRDRRRLGRGRRRSYTYLSSEFLSNYKHLPPVMNSMGMFTYVRSYSQYLPEEGRREYWWETVARAVDYNIGLVKGSKKEAEELFDNIFNLRQFLSGRTLWSGGGEASKHYPMSSFNCAFVAIDDVDALHELFYLLLVGAGVGFLSVSSDVSKLPLFRVDLKIEHEYYDPKPKNSRLEYTNFVTNGSSVKIVVGDSKEGWKQSLEFFLKILTDKAYRKVSKVIFNYDNVRPKGERLKTFGGFASGHESLHDMFKKIYQIISSTSGRLSTVDVIDVCNIIGEGVVSGGVRRTAEIAIISEDDQDAMTMKSDLYTQVDGKWEVDESIIHRQMSNNSIIYTSKPARDKLSWHLGQMRYSGEPGLINYSAGSIRRDNFRGVNPCAEILLDSRGLCNLTEVNVSAFASTPNIKPPTQAIRSGMPALPHGPDWGLKYHTLYFLNTLSIFRFTELSGVDIKLPLQCCQVILHNHRCCNRDRTDKDRSAWQATCRFQVSHKCGVCAPCALPIGHWHLHVSIFHCPSPCL